MVQICRGDCVLQTNGYMMLLIGVCAVQADWIPKLLPQYCHFSGPEQSPAPWYCPVSGKVKCQQQSTFCKPPPSSLVLCPSDPYLKVLMGEACHFFFLVL